MTKADIAAACQTLYDTIRPLLFSLNQEGGRVPAEFHETITVLTRLALDGDDVALDLLQECHKNNAYALGASVEIVEKHLDETMPYTRLSPALELFAKTLPSTTRRIFDSATAHLNIEGELNHLGTKIIETCVRNEPMLAEELVKLADSFLTEKSYQGLSGYDEIQEGLIRSLLVAVEVNPELSGKARDLVVHVRDKYLGTSKVGIFRAVREVLPKIREIGEQYPVKVRALGAANAQLKQLSPV
ncbi:MAG: hypothetical protein PHY92_02495 [Alphaproteobacteria bacterium]|nr:hypothetical protein [Alphaproteobacteria bacterium]